MLVNYYDKYGLTRDKELRVSFLKSRLSQLRRNEMAYGKFRTLFQDKINKINSDPTLTEIEKKRKIGQLMAQNEENEYNHNETLGFIGKLSDALGLDKNGNPLSAEFEEDVDEETKQDKIDEAYFAYRYYELCCSLRQKAIKSTTISEQVFKEDGTPEYDEHLNIKFTRRVETPEETAQRMREVEFESRQMSKAFSIFFDKEKRKRYDIQLEGQEYAERVNRGIIERKKASEDYVKSVLGEDFDPDRSEIVKEELKRGTQSDRSWEFDLYKEPEPLYIGRSDYEETPVLNSDIYAFRYGAFNFKSMIRKDGEANFEHSICELIGVTTVDSDGKQKTDFIIAPLRDNAQLVYLTQSEIDKYRQQGITIEETQSLEESRRQREIEQRSKRREEIRKKNEQKYRNLHPKMAKIKDGVKGAKSLAGRIKEGISAFVKDTDVYDDLKEEQQKQPQTYKKASNIIDFQEYQRMKSCRGTALRSVPEDSVYGKDEPKRRVVLFQPKNKKFGEKDSEFVSKVLFSRYMIDNAVENNAGYIGTISGVNGKKYIELDVLDDEVISACAHAQTQPGTVRKEYSDGAFSRKAKVANLKELTDDLSTMQVILTSETIEKKAEQDGGPNKKEGTEGYPDFDD